MATISKFLVVPSRVESGSSQTELQTNSDYAGGLSGMHTTTAGTLPSSIFRNIRFFFGFRKIIGNPEKKRILRSGGYSMVPLPLVLVSRDTWTTPEKTLAWWYDSPSADMVSVSTSLRKSHCIIVIEKFSTSSAIRGLLRAWYCIPSGFSML